MEMFLAKHNESKDLFSSNFQLDLLLSSISVWISHELMYGKNKL